MSFMTTATVIHSVPEKGWGLAKAPDESIFFLHVSHAGEAEYALRGAELVRQESWPIEIPPIETEIVFMNSVPSYVEGRYPQATCWMTVKYFEEYYKGMLAAAKKAAATLAALAEENREANLRRQQRIAISQHRHAGGGKGKKQKQTAGR